MYINVSALFWNTTYIAVNKENIKNAGERIPKICQNFIHSWIFKL